jgi:DNA-directed RNA polymerase subunit RPC12/RpoP
MTPEQDEIIEPLSLWDCPNCGYRITGDFLIYIRYEVRCPRCEEVKVGDFVKVDEEDG